MPLANSSTIRINLRPARLDLLLLLLGQLAILRRALQPCRSQAHVDVVLQGRAHAHGLPHEAAGVAFVQSCHDLFAAW